MAEQYSYIKNLKVDKNILKGFLPGYLTNIRLVILVVIVIVVSGIFSFLNLPRRLNPEIKIPIIIVSTALPGASPEDVESLITDPLETEISSVKGIKQMTSSSNQGFSSIVIEFNSGIDVDKARDDVKNQVDTVTDLPEDANDPKVESLDFENQPVISFALTSNAGTADLITNAKNLKLKLERDSNTDRVILSGIEEEEFQILINLEKLNELQINPITLMQIIKSSLNSYPAGNLKTTESSYSVGLSANIKNIEDIRNTRMLINGINYKLSEIANISEKSKPDQNKAFFAYKGGILQESVNIDVFKTSTAEIDASSIQFKRLIDEYIKENPNVSAKYVQDTGHEISDQFDELENNFRDTIILVFVALLVFIGIRQAFIASTTIPLTILNTFFIMNLINMPLSFLSLFALILALGLVVDDTIVIISAMTRYQSKGKFDPRVTGIFVWRDFIIPIWTTTITTIWSFLPLLLSTGIIGEFIKPIPIIVSVSLISSTAIAVLITLPLMIEVYRIKVPPRVKILIIGFTGLAIITGVYIILPATFLRIPTLIFILLLVAFAYTQRALLLSKINSLIIKIPSNTRTIGIKYINHGILNIDELSDRYHIVIKKMLNSTYRIWQTIAAVAIFTIFSYLLAILGFVQNEFFPSGDSNLVFVNIEYPPGTNKAVTAQNVSEVANQIKSISDLEFLTVSTGTTRGNDDNNSSGDNFAAIILNLTDYKKVKRERSALKIIDDLTNQFVHYQKGKVTVSSQEGGPPAGADIQVSLLGDDMYQLDDLTNKMMAYLGTKQGVINIEKSIKTGTSKITFVPDNFKLAKYNISNADIGSAIRLLASGLKADDIKINEESIDITIRLFEDIPDVENLNQVKISSNKGPISLSELGFFTLETNPTVIRRLDQKRQATVTASVQEGFNITTINADLEKYIDTELNMPSGYSRQTGGVNEENQRSITSILQAMVLSGLLILITMVIQFKSYRQAIICMSVIPLAISGVFIIFAITQTPLSFPSLIGILALFGIVVTHSMVMVDKISKNVSLGVPLKEAVANGAASRLEPVALTSLVSIVGLIPITLSDPIWQGLGGAIIAGLLFSGIIMLLFIPAVYYLTYRGELKNNL